MKYNWQKLTIGASMTLHCSRRCANGMAKRWGEKLNRKFQVTIIDGDVKVFRLAGGYAPVKYPWKKIKIGESFEMDCQLTTGRTLASRQGAKLDRHYVVSDEDGVIVCRRYR